MRLITALVISGALCVGSIAAVDVAVAGTGHTDAVAAKKKKKKKKKSNPIFKALSGRTLNRVISNTPNPAGTEQYAFCRNGTYAYKKVDYNGSFLYQTTYNGSWRVVTSSGTAGVVQYDVGNFVSIFSDGTPAESSPASVIAQPVTLGPFGVLFGGNQYTVGGGIC